MAISARSLAISARSLVSSLSVVIYYSGSNKKVMHERHEKEMKEMHTRHEKEAGAEGHHEDGAEAGAGGSAGKRSEPIKKAEEGKKG